MIVNGLNLLRAAPIANMETTKLKSGGVSYGLAECGYDVRILDDVRFIYDPEGRKVTYVGNHVFDGHAVLVNVMELFQMPTDLVGIGYNKSSWNRKQLQINQPVIEPGWRGVLTLGLVYSGNVPLHVPAGAGIMQVIFTRLESQAEYTGRYQDQRSEIVPSITLK